MLEDLERHEWTDSDIIDFALMIRRLVQRVRKYEMAKQALSLLERKGIKSNLLR